MPHLVVIAGTCEGHYVEPVLIEHRQPAQVDVGGVDEVAALGEIDSRHRVVAGRPLFSCLDLDEDNLPVFLKDEVYLEPVHLPIALADGVTLLEEILGGEALGLVAPIAVFGSLLPAVGHGHTALKLMSRPLTLWVSAPTEMKSTPASP